jgi:hypothetical protein
MYIAEAIGVGFQPLASHYPDKSPDFDQSFESELMKIYLESFKNLDQHFMQRKLKASFHKAFVNNNFIGLRKRNIILSSGSHYSHIMEIFTLYCFNLPSFNNGFAKYNMTWPPWPIFGIIIFTRYQNSRCYLNPKTVQLKFHL